MATTRETIAPITIDQDIQRLLKIDEQKWREEIKPFTLEKIDNYINQLNNNITLEDEKVKAMRTLASAGYNYVQVDDIDARARTSDRVVEIAYTHAKKIIGKMRNLNQVFTEHRNHLIAEQRRLDVAYMTTLIQRKPTRDLSDAKSDVSATADEVSLAHDQVFGEIVTNHKEVVELNQQLREQLTVALEKLTATQTENQSLKSDLNTLKTQMAQLQRQVADMKMCTEAPKPQDNPPVSRKFLS